MTQSEVAALYGVSLRTVQRWEKSKSLHFEIVFAVVEQVCNLKLGHVLLMGYEDE